MTEITYEHRLLLRRASVLWGNLHKDDVARAAECVTLGLLERREMPMFGEVEWRLTDVGVVESQTVSELRFMLYHGVSRALARKASVADARADHYAVTRIAERLVVRELDEIERVRRDQGRCDPGDLRAACETAVAAAVMSGDRAHAAELATKYAAFAVLEGRGHATLILDALALALNGVDAPTTPAPTASSPQASTSEERFVAAAGERCVWLVEWWGLVTVKAALLHETTGDTRVVSVGDRGVSGSFRVDNADPNTKRFVHVGPDAEAHARRHAELLVEERFDRRQVPMQTLELDLVNDKFALKGALVYADACAAQSPQIADYIRKTAEYLTRAGAHHADWYVR
ncbi:MAG: hypothetical protein ACHREM_02265 [Polyangiales bacterium]